MLHDLTSRHTFQLKATAADLISLTNEAQCLTLPDQNLLVMGDGSNTIFLAPYEGTVLHNALRGINMSADPDAYYIVVAAGENWHEFVEHCIGQGWNGLENLVLIPGTVGAAPVQNIGAYGVEVSRYVKSVRAWDRSQHRFVELSQHDCEFAYRDSIFKQHPERYIILSVTFRLPKQWQPECSYGPLKELGFDVTPRQIANQVIAIRQQKLPDPKLRPNAGSFFKNPLLSITQVESLRLRYPTIPHYPVSSTEAKVAAGWLIEQCGLKGLEIGGIQVHPQQALVLVNTGTATASDLITMIRYIQDCVWREFGIWLVPEVRLIGAHGLLNEDFERCRHD